MKYYIHFADNTIRDDGEVNDGVEYRFPTDPMYKQDGVYNQLCKYRLCNFVMTNLSDDEKQALATVGTLVIRFDGTTTQNEYRLFNGKGIGALTAPSSMNGPSPLEFHIRLDENLVLMSDTVIKTLPNQTAYSNQMYGDNTLPEYIASALWGQKPSLSYWVYDGFSSWFPLKEIANVTDVNLSFTIEMEPISAKLN